MYDQVLRWVGPSRVALVTDAMAAAGMADGAYRLGTLDVTVRDGRAQVAGTETIAGGTATMDRLFRVAVGGPAGLADDARLLAAAEQTSGVPLRALGLPARDLSVGSPADLVVLTPGLDVERVVVGQADQVRATRGTPGR